MIAKLALLLLAVADLGAARLDKATHRELLLSGRPKVGLWKALNDEALAAALQTSSQTTFSPKPRFEAYCFDQPISHFDKTVNGTFCHRYWADASHYKEGGPIFLLDGGETSGEDRLPFLETGIAQILANATNGLAIVLEHRYYGESVPVKSFSTDDLRFLNNNEALEDSAYFIKNFQPPKSLLKLSNPDALKPKNAPWFYYGGSYAGARAAHMRVEYPDLVWGAIASSAVTHAQIDFPQYFDPIQEYADSDCISAIQTSVQVIDGLLSLPGPINRGIKGLFGLEALEDDDFAEVLTYPFGAWQGQNWNPGVSTDAWDNFCEAITSGGAGSQIGLIKIPAEINNYANWIKKHYVSLCPIDIVDCFGSHNDEAFLADDLEQSWRLWLFQVCTEWGYFMPAPEEGPSILSKRLTLEYTSKICKQAYPPGKHFTVPEWPNVADVNDRGDYDIEYSRLAFIDGDRDPWRTMTPQADWARKRKSSVDKPVHLIFDAIHHYDENGLENHDEEPARIRDVHELEVSFITEWVAQFHEAKGKQ
ncbi:putative extracellular serine carboxypeptidase [Vanrija pseudolonga]|uniref:Extracellular serine carboxypeptidase n=1 Tax=Vanrija pseudolonga TaxID=143232 RepID=A0AAF0YDR4_9TREE|nr:putative extracellular serine carboxypeptidase [Vanrija pseudolonga]